MRSYNTIITLSQNERGIWDIDTTKGCTSGTALNKKGCYGDCYAARSAKMYGIDFTKTVKRYFINDDHANYIKRQIEKVSLPFVRIGVTGDPSEEWEHTIDVIKKLRHNHQLELFPRKQKEIVIITKHWKILTDLQLFDLSRLGVCINTSVSALDNIEIVKGAVNEYRRIKPYLKSILRIISCDFNLDNEHGRRLNLIQSELFKNDNIIDTVFRVSKNNPLVKDGIINVKQTKFLGKKCLVSKYNKKTYFGKCSTCAEMCGVTI
jgi:hypothetical protein